ncbi:MAG: nitroreductase family protein [Erysipelotrichales bacterium]
MKEIYERRSIRSYTNKDVSDELVSKVIDAARVAPSGSNNQPWRFIVVRDEVKRAQISKVCENQEWMNQAPVHIVCIAEGASRGINDDILFDEQTNGLDAKRLIRDTSIGITHLILEAQHLGLGTCWIAWFDEIDIKTVMNLPQNTYVVGVITLGYATNKVKARNRKELSEIMFFEEYNK